MAKLSVLITEKFPSSLRGEITRWMIEIKSGVFIGTLSKLVRELLWEKLEKSNLKGGAIFIEPAANEQKYKIKTFGNFSRTPRNFEGINLMTIPSTSSDPSSTKKSSNAFNPFTYFANRLDIKPSMASKITWNVPKKLPPNFVIRTFSLRLEKDQFFSNYAAQSSYFEYPPERVWSPSEIKEIQFICEMCLDSWNLHMKSNPEEISDKILSFCLETTDYKPKATEGYVDVVGLCYLYHSSETQCPTLVFQQGFNMTRQRTNAAALLFHFWRNFQNISHLVVVDQTKNLSQFSLLVKENKLTSPDFPHVIDISERFPSIEEIIERFNKLKNHNLTKQYSSKYSEYYQLFKGDTTTQIHKNIIPIGRYNLLKIVLGLFLYLHEKDEFDITPV
ncbi:type I-E CRISPR-associated endoribonuclease Cas2e [Candidatus Harpocratesius sp.]